MQSSLKERIICVTPQTFDALALELFKYQAVHNPVYSLFLGYLGVNIKEIQSINQIPFLPIGFFKTQTVLTSEAIPKITFASSGTTGAITSRHFVADLNLYEMVSQQIFEATYGPLTNWNILALLPSYLERNDSSLVYMVNHFIEKTASPYSGFYLNHRENLIETLTSALNSGKKTLLWGVTFALLDFVEELGLDYQYPDNLIVMETGGMKGRRREILREEVHLRLQTAFGVPEIHSEYGMTELLSQAYSLGDGLFVPSSTMKILLRDVNDPFRVGDPTLRRGGINVIDLANINSCCFVETQDLGSLEPNGFRVLGRFDNADLRGCNLLVQ